MTSSYTRDVLHGSIAQAVAGAAGFSYTVLTARWLGRADFGLFQAVMAIYGVLMTVGALLGGVAVQRLAAASAGQREVAVSRMVRIAVALGGACAVLVLVAAPVMVRLLQADGPGVLLALAALIAAAVILATVYGCLQGANRYSGFMYAKCAESILFVGCGALFIGLGGGAWGAVLGYATAMSITAAVLLRRPGWCRWSAAHDSSPAARGSPLTLLAIYGALFFVVNCPAIAARMRLSADQAGLYGVLFSLKNAVLPFVFALCLPLYSRGISQHADAGNGRRALGVAALLCGGFCLVGWLWPQWIVTRLFGGDYCDAAPFVLMYGGFLTVHVLSMVWMFGQAGQGRLRAHLLIVPLGVAGLSLVAGPASISSLILIQALAWAAYLVAAIGVAAVDRVRLNEPQPSKKPECA